MFKGIFRLLWSIATFSNKFRVGKELGTADKFGFVTIRQRSGVLAKNSFKEINSSKIKKLKKYSVTPSYMIKHVAGKVIAILSGRDNPYFFNESIHYEKDCREMKKTVVPVFNAPEEVLAEIGSSLQYLDINYSDMTNKFNLLYELNLTDFEIRKLYPHNKDYTGCRVCGSEEPTSVIGYCPDCHGHGIYPTEKEVDKSGKIYGARIEQLKEAS